MGKKSNQARFPLVSLVSLVITLATCKLNLARQARIKKMIQQDEDVGKVAQATPIVVCKSPPLLLTRMRAQSI